jgi:hypothetical protein
MSDGRQTAESWHGTRIYLLVVLKESRGCSPDQKPLEVSVEFVQMNRMLCLVALTVVATGCDGRPLSSIRPTEDIAVSAGELTRAYEKNAVAADESYRGKMVRLTGEVEKIGSESSGGYMIVSGIRCEFGADWNNVLSQFVLGTRFDPDNENLQLFGICRGKSGDIILSSCRIYAKE